MPARSTVPVRRSTWTRPAWPLVFCALAICGCANWRLPRLDPTGERVFLPADAPWPPIPPGATPAAPPVGPNTGVSLSPSAIIAPVGSEVVMIASVIGGEGFLLTNEIIEWTIEPNTVGLFLSAGERRTIDVLNWWRGLPVKIDSRFVANATLRYPMTLDRGTPSPLDDIFVQTGQSWVTVTSPVQGTSRVTAFAPQVPDWNSRQQSATIYWIDAQWQFPPPAITQTGGRNTLVTTLVRQTDAAPLAGWPVRYEIASGPEAGFAPDGAPSVEIVTNASGQAAAEIFQRQAAAGTNEVHISILQPSGPGGQTQPLVVGAGSVLQTWGSAGAPPPSVAPQPAPGGFVPSTPPTLEPSPAPPSAAQLEVTISGPTTGTVGDNLPFQIQVTNRGTSVATGLMVTGRFDPGWEHAAVAGAIQRDLVDLQPGAAAQLTINLRITQAGQLCQYVEVTGDGGLRATASHCLSATTPPIEQPAPGEERWEPEPSGVQPTPMQPPAEQPSAEEAQPASGSALSVRKTGPSRRRVGETALFTIEVTNRSESPIEDVVIADHFETTLEPARATEGNEWLEGNALGWRIGTLDAGSTIRRDIELRCLQETPRACNRVTVTGRGIVPVAEEACLEITDAQTVPEATAPEARPRETLRVSVAETTDPLRVGGKTTYQVLVENSGDESFFDVVVSAKLSPQLKLETVASPVGPEGAVMPEGVRFVPVRELRAGEAPLSFDLHAAGVEAGAAVVEVEVSSRGQSEPITARQTTQVVP